MSAKREDYDREHQRAMKSRHGQSDFLEDFPLNPVEMAREALKNDIERKANKDAYDGRYDPPTKEKEAAARKEAEKFERQQKRRPPSSPGPFLDNDAASSGGEWDWVIKLGFWLAAIVFVIWLVAMAMAITVVLSPIWLGAVTVGVITGFILAQSASTRISDETLSRVPVVEEQKRKKTRIRIAEEFIKGSVKFSPHLLCLIMATAGYGLALTAWPFFMTADIFTRILLGVGVAAGTILGTLAGRRVLCWQLENSIFTRAESENPTRLLAPKLALGFSIPGFVALAGLWIIVLFQSPANLDLAKAFGFKDGPQAIQQPAPGQTIAHTSASNTGASVSNETGIGSENFKRLLHGNYKIEINRERGEFVVEMDWMARLGAVRLVAPMAALDFERTEVGETARKGAFRDSTIVLVPIRPGRHASRKFWTSNPGADSPWKTSVPPQTQEEITDAIEFYAQGPSEAEKLVSALKRIGGGPARQSGASARTVTQRRNEEPKQSSKNEPVPSQSELSAQLTRLAKGDVLGNGSNEPAAQKWSGQSAKHGERFPQTRTRLLSPGDLSGLSKDDLRYAINEMFARYGADFPKAEVKRQFAGFEWYKPRQGIDFDRLEAEFSDLERANLKLLGAVRDSNTKQSGAASSETQSQIAPVANQHGIPNGTYHNSRPIDAKDANSSARITTTFIIRGDEFDFITCTSQTINARGRARGVLAFDIKDKTTGKIVSNADGTVRFTSRTRQIISQSPKNLSESFLKEFRQVQMFDNRWNYLDGKLRNLSSQSSNAIWIKD